VELSNEFHCSYNHVLCLIVHFCVQTTICIKHNTDITIFLYKFSGAVVITDGVFALPDASAVDSLLAQLRASTVCCSFIKVGSGFHAHCR